jgi:hypothetical protein
MVTEPLVTVRLEEPKLQFDFDNRKAVHTNPFEGLRDYGPYDASIRRREGVRPTRVVMVGRADRLATLESVSAILTANRLGKLHDSFVLQVVDQITVPPTSINDEAESYRRAIDEWFGAAAPYGRDVNLAVVLHGNRLLYKGASPYYSAKAAFMRRGIPTQSICYENVSPTNLEQFRRYYVANILTACYAKIGGIPWVVQAGATGCPEVTIGVATTAVPSDGGIERYVGISTIFRENGAFALWDITSPEQDWEKYAAQLEASVVRAIRTFETRENKRVSRLACHVSGKRAGFRETEAITRALAQFPGRTIMADLVHVTDDAALWLMDGADATLLPEPGLLTHLTLDGTSALMHTEGRGSGSRFLTRPLQLKLYSELPENGCLDVYQHLYDLRWMSWRGVRTAGGPVSVAYPKEMARLLAYLYEQEGVRATDFLSGLESKAWFL